MNEHGFAPPTPDDHRPWLWVASLACPVYSMLALAARFISKWGALHVDDALLAAAYVFALVHWAVLYDALSLGLGSSAARLSKTALQRVALLYFTSRIFLLLALGFSKASTAQFTRRIFSSTISKERLAFTIVLVSCIVWLILAVVLSTAGCHPSEALVPTSDALCSANEAKWKLITALDVITEVALLALPLFFVLPSNFRVSQKMAVLFVFSFRLLVGLLSVGALVSYLNYLRDGAESIGLAPAIAWQEVLLSSSLMSASIPCLRTFVRAFMSRETAGLQFGITNAAVISRPSRYISRSIHLTSWTKSKVADSEAQGNSSVVSRLRRDRPESKTDTSCKDLLGSKSGNSEREDIAGGTIDEIELEPG